MARRGAARTVNSIITSAYWEVGRRIVQEEQKGHHKAGYGERLIDRDELVAGRDDGDARCATCLAPGPADELLLAC